MVKLIEFQIRITFTVIRLDGGGLAKVEEVEHEEEEKKSRQRHRQEKDLGLSINGGLNGKEKPQYYWFIHVKIWDRMSRDVGALWVFPDRVDHVEVIEWLSHNIRSPGGALNKSRTMVIFWLWFWLLTPSCESFFDHFLELAFIQHFRAGLAELTIVMPGQFCNICFVRVSVGGQVIIILVWLMQVKSLSNQILSNAIPGIVLCGW